MAALTQEIWYWGLPKLRVFQMREGGCSTSICHDYLASAPIGPCFGNKTIMEGHMKAPRIWHLNYPFITTTITQSCQRVCWGVRAAAHLDLAAASAAARSAAACCSRLAARWRSLSWSSASDCWYARSCSSLNRRLKSYHR